MKKSLITLLIVVMSITFFVLLYFQISYMDNMVKMREGQFSEGVMRSLHSTSGFLERQEALQFLEEDVSIIEASTEPTLSSPSTTFDLRVKTRRNLYGSDSYPVQPMSERYMELQNAVREQYLYQKGLLEELVLTIMSDAGSRPLFERADSALITSSLEAELAANGIELPFRFALADNTNHIIYADEGFSMENGENVYSDVLFPNSNQTYKLLVMFPTKHKYIYSSVRFIIPTLALSIILLFIFIYTIVMIMRQKKITEMKSDFISNMTHELKTPISSISLAGQMLGDEAVTKSPTMLKHIANVIVEESKRLKFQVDKVLQLSVFDDSTSETALKFSEVHANSVISSVANNFKLRLNKDGGTLDCNLNASNDVIYVDEMQFTNIINNLLENALKYRKEDVPPVLTVTTRDLSKNRLEISVKDNGIGIKKDDLKHIFERFYRVHTGNRHDVKGFGLGLAYVKKMMSLFNGEVTAESEIGKWTELKLIFPLSEASLPR
ncbi:MAG: HAMP domain-containing histidine kinase [Muribaculaceae bacterium]|nr:HAMP domain-containing histidine kinase [Muribaculaceae bacterium]